MKEMGSFGKPGILKRLQELSATVDRETEVIVVGASAILLKYADARYTMDIDILQNVVLPKANELDIQLVSPGIMQLLPGYEERLVLIDTFGNLTVKAISPLDVALTKMTRGLDRDLSDVKGLLDRGEPTLEEFKEFYGKQRSVYGGSVRMMDDAFFAVTGIRWPKEERLFD